MCCGGLFDEARRETASLLKTGKEEFDRGNQLVAFSLLLEAKNVFNEMLQSQFEKTHGSAAAEFIGRTKSTQSYCTEEQGAIPRPA